MPQANAAKANAAHATDQPKIALRHPLSRPLSLVDWCGVTVGGHDGSPEDRTTVVGLARSSGSLDVVVCEQARVSRDRSYDGLFFSGVRTTGVYCRPVCPVRPAKAQNVSFYLSAAAAEQDGFRPCLRCRPEAAPFSPAWKGSQTTVKRAIRLICNGALNDASVKGLAERLGIGSRHLSRLFTRHLGASPTQVARTTRVQRANASCMRPIFQCRRLHFARAFAACGASTPCSPRCTRGHLLRSGELAWAVDLGLRSPELALLRPVRHRA